MRYEIIYSTSEILKQKINKGHFIPYHVIAKQRYQKNSIYYNDYWNMCFRVIGVEYETSTGELDNAYVKADDKTYHLISTELNVNDYLLKKDEKEIYKLDDIVQLKYPLTGAEIIYWFYTHKINSLNPKYKGFWKFIDPDSANRISDHAKYLLNAQINEKGNYYMCSMTKLGSNKPSVFMRPKGTRKKVIKKSDWK